MKILASNQVNAAAGQLQQQLVLKHRRIYRVLHAQLYSKPLAYGMVVTRVCSELERLLKLFLIDPRNG